MKGIHAMIEKPDFSASSSVNLPLAAPADQDVWNQLAEFASRTGTDPVLRLLVDEACENHRNLRGVTATIVNRYRALIDAIPDAITMHDETGRTVDVNESACRLLEKNRDALIGSLIAEIFPDLGEDFRKHLRDASDGEESVIGNATLTRLDQPPVALELNARVYLDGQQKRIIVATRKLAKREQSHERLRRSEAHLRQLLRDMDKGVIVRNQRGHIVSSNPAACRMLQMSEPDLLALRSDQLGDWRFVDEHNQPIDQHALPWSRAMTTGKPVESAICGLNSPHADTTLWVSIASVPGFDSENARPDHVVSIFADITPIKRDASLFAHAQSLTNLGAWQLVAGSDRMIWSAQMHAIFDVPLTTPISRDRMLSHFTGMDLRRLRQALDAAKSEETTEITARITTAIGRRRQVKIRVRGLDPIATCRDVIGCVQDVTSDNESDFSIAIE